MLDTAVRGREIVYANLADHLFEIETMMNLSLLGQEKIDTTTMFGLVAAIVVFGVLLIFLFIFTRYFGLWIQSQLTRANITFFNLLGMTFRKVNTRAIVRSKIMATQAGLVDPELTVEALEAHYLAGGNVQQVIRALIAAKKAKTISLTFREATAIDLAGRDVLESVQTSVYPKVIDCPATRICETFARCGRQRRDPTQGQGSRDRACQPAAVDRWCHRRNDHCSRG